LGRSLGKRLELKMSKYYGVSKAKRAMLEKRDALLKKLRQMHPEAHVTEHAPHGGSPGGFMAHVWGKSLSGWDLHPTAIKALEEALKNMCIARA